MRCILKLNTPFLKSLLCSLLSLLILYPLSFRIKTLSCLFIINDFKMSYCPHVNEGIGRTFSCRYERYGSTCSFTVSEYWIQVLKNKYIHIMFFFFIGFKTESQKNRNPTDICEP